MPARSKGQTLRKRLTPAFWRAEKWIRRNGYEKLKQSQYYGIGLLVLMLVVFWAVFKVLAPTTFGSPEKLATYMKSALIYAVGGCGLYFICVMGPFDYECWCQYRTFHPLSPAMQVRIRLCRSYHCTADLWYDHWSHQWYCLY